jgi:hypothetical protein
MYPPWFIILQKRSNLVCPETITGVTIYSNNGTVVNSFGAVKTNNKLDVSDVKPGIYVAAFKTEEGIISREFVKQ